MRYMTNPKNRLIIDPAGSALTLEGELLKYAKIILNENAVHTATLVLDNDSFVFPSILDTEQTIYLSVTDAGSSFSKYCDGYYLFAGVNRFPISDVNPKNREVALSLDHLKGVALKEMTVANEYGAQSANPTLDTISEILTDANQGIITKYVNKILGSATNSGYSVNVDCEAVADIINYVEFPYKPADKALNDLCDLVTALNAGSAGIHWTVGFDGYLKIKSIDQDLIGTHTDWTKYYGGSQAEATLTYREDYDSVNTEKISAEANYIIYYGNWRKPSNGDAWTNADCDSIWTGVNDAGTSYKSVLTEDTVTFKVGTSSLRVTNDAVGGGHSACYIPVGKQAAWDFSSFTDFNVPTLNFYVLAHGNIANLNVGVYNIAGDGTTVDAYGAHSLSADGLTEYDKWYHYSLPLGPYYNSPERFQDFKWYGTGALDWSAIDAIQFYWDAGEDSYICLDGFYFGDAHVCRVAWNSNDTKIKQRIIVDDIGKDDSLKASDDSGVMAQLAYAEYLRCSSEYYINTITVPMLPNALPGQLFYVDGVDMRATQIIHEITESQYKTTLHLTSDLTNGRSRPRYEDLNKQYANIRPNFQDREASNMKAGTVDYRITRLAKDYA